MRRTKRIPMLITMIFLLIATFTFAGTGAWYVDNISKTSNSTFGNIDITEQNFGIVGVNTVDTSNTKLFPGSALNFSGTITNTADPAYIAYQIELVFQSNISLSSVPTGWSYDAATKKLTYETKAKAYASGAVINLADDLTGISIPQMLKAGQTEQISVSLNVFAIQQANTNDDVTADVTTYSQLVALNDE